VRIHT